jgi:hypothetical protein
MEHSSKNLSHAEFQFLLLRSSAWDMYASAALSMSMHPGTTRDKATPRTAAEIATIADQLLAERDKRYGPYQSSFDCDITDGDERSS